MDVGLSSCIVYQFSILKYDTCSNYQSEYFVEIDVKLSRDIGHLMIK